MLHKSHNVPPQLIFHNTPQRLTKSAKNKWTAFWKTGEKSGKAVTLTPKKEWREVGNFSRKGQGGT